MPKKALIVDDDADVRDVVKMILDMEGIHVSELASGQLVVDTVLKERPDIILLDVLLGDMDGRDIRKKLKAQTDTRDIPIIIISATHGYHTRHEKRCGADDYLGKPFDIDELVGCVNKQLHY